MPSVTPIAVLGCGRIGRMHARVLARHPGAHLVAVYDVIPEMAAETSRELGARAAASVAEVLGDPGIAAVLIATPTHTHVELIIAAARAGKAVLCEKPIDLDMARVLECEAAIRDLRCTVMIGFNRRFDPSFRALRERVQAGEIGRVEQVIITSRDPSPPPATYVATSGGLFRDMTIHDFDMARYLVGDLAEVHAVGAVLIDPAIGAAGDVDSAMVTLRSRSGALVHINNSRRCVYGYDQRLEAFGSGGMLLAANRHATTVQRFGSAHTGAADVVLPFFTERYAEAYSAEIGHFLDCVSSGATPLTSFADGVEALRIADAAQESLRTGMPVHLDNAV
jgi:myo-inositol 2-dehydrogenase/D-chiro-inositol 1-dehydrogenase